MSTPSNGKEFTKRRMAINPVCTPSKILPFKGDCGVRRGRFRNGKKNREEREQDTQVDQERIYNCEHRSSSLSRMEIFSYSI